jgi:hypothetical protein
MGFWYGTCHCSVRDGDAWKIAATSGGAKPSLCAEIQALAAKLGADAS